MNATDRLWAKYKLGERSKIIDPMTKQPAVRNIFYDDSSDISVKAIQARGTISGSATSRSVASRSSWPTAVPDAGRRRSRRSHRRTDPGVQPDAVARDGARPRTGAWVHYMKP